jgi:hypothetical protein
MQIQSWWRGMVAKHAVQKQFNAVSIIQCFMRRCLARQQYLQRKFIFMLIHTAEKERIKKVVATRMQEQMRDYMEQHQRNESARVIQRFFLRVKHEVDELVREQKRRKKWKKKMMKTTTMHPDNLEEALLEDAWEMSVSNATMDDTMDEEPFTRSYANTGAGSVIHMDNRRVASIDHESLDRWDYPKAAAAAKPWYWHVKEE